MLQGVTIWIRPVTLPDRRIKIAVMSNLVSISLRGSSLQAMMRRILQEFYVQKDMARISLN